MKFIKKNLHSKGLTSLFLILSFLFLYYFKHTVVLLPSPPICLYQPSQKNLAGLMDNKSIIYPHDVKHSSSSEQRASDFAATVKQQQECGSHTCGPTPTQPLSRPRLVLVLVSSSSHPKKAARSRCLACFPSPAVYLFRRG